jgi:8-oxo-dGTP diphosphatase
VGSSPISSTKNVLVRALWEGLSSSGILRRAHYVPFSTGPWRLITGRVGQVRFTAPQEAVSGCEDRLVRELLTLDVAAAALADATEAVAEYEDAVAWFTARMGSYSDPLAVEVWIFNATLSHVVLVEHRWRGWVPPGGKAEVGEIPRVAAAREVVEETGLVVEVRTRPAAAMVRSYHPAGPLTLGLSYAAIADPALPLIAEPGQPVEWKSLNQPWASSFPHDIERIRNYVESTGAGGRREP